MDWMCHHKAWICVLALSLFMSMILNVPLNMVQTYFAGLFFKKQNLVSYENFYI